MLLMHPKRGDDTVRLAIEAPLVERNGWAWPTGPARIIKIAVHWRRGGADDHRRRPRLLFSRSIDGNWFSLPTMEQNIARRTLCGLVGRLPNMVTLHRFSTLLLPGYSHINDQVPVAISWRFATVHSVRTHHPSAERDEMQGFL